MTLLEVYCDYNELISVIDSFLHEKGVAVKKSVYRGHRVIIYRIGLFRKLVIEYDPYSKTAIIKCSNPSLLSELGNVLRRKLGSWSIQQKKDLRVSERSYLNQLLEKVIERNIFFYKAKYSKKFLLLYSIPLIIIILLSFTVNSALILVSIVVAILLFAPHNRVGPQRYGINPEDTFIPILYLRYRSKLKVLDSYIRQQLPLLPSKDREFIELALRH